jgi:hypothetical protein
MPDRIDEARCAYREVGEVKDNREIPGPAIEYGVPASRYVYVETPGLYDVSRPTRDLDERGASPG